MHSHPFRQYGFRKRSTSNETSLMWFRTFEKLSRAMKLLRLLEHLA